MSRERKLRRAAVFAVLALAAAWCQAAGAPIVLAQVASQTNASAATNSRGMVLGMTALFDQVNAAGGIGGRMIKLVNLDDDLNPKRMVEITTQQLLPDPNVLALIGYVNTGGLTALAKDNAFGKSGIAMIAPLQGDHQVVDADNVFPFRAGYADEVKALVQHAKTMGHRRLAVVAYSIAFGPAMAKVAEEAARKQGLEVSVTMVDGAPDRIEQNMAEAARKVAEHQPGAVLMVCAGRYATELAKALQSGPAAGVQMYGMSVILAENLVNALGVNRARGIVLAQAVPFPFAQGIPLVYEYQRTMQARLPNEPLSFATLEGFAAAKIAVEGLRRAGPNLTREKIAQALNGAGEINLGGIYVKYAKAVRYGWRNVDLTIIGANGKLVR
jgi:branched-chain amino acid transport system substrate-binding protein